MLKRLCHWHDRHADNYWLVRWLILRMLGFVWVAAFLSLALQVLGLVGSSGILPAAVRIENLPGFGTLSGFIDTPSIFLFGAPDWALLLFAWVGVGLSITVLIGYANFPLMIALWFLYFSYQPVMGLWHGYGWDMQILETGLLGAIIAPLWNARPFPSTRPVLPAIWMFRWMTMRIHLGTGLIKFRGDACWRELTCLDWHFWTQPLPGPLSPFFHALPQWMGKIGVALTHTSQSIAGFFSFGPRKLRLGAAWLMLGVQGVLILSGNLSFLNWLTIVPILALFDDSQLQRMLPKKLIARKHAATTTATTSTPHLILSIIMLLVVIVFSIPVVANLLSEDQRMNSRFDKLGIVNTYGAFGSITKDRVELVVLGEDTNGAWHEYEFFAKPSDVRSPHPIVSPLQPRLDWQLWFAAFGQAQHSPWTAAFVYRLLENEPDVTRLLKHNPFEDEPPRRIRIDAYRYAMQPPDATTRWEREYLGAWLPPLSLRDEGLERYVAQLGVIAHT